MTSGLLKVWNSFRGTVSGVDTDRQLALGAMFGMMIGMMPKDSLFCYALFVLMMFTTANLFSALISGFAFTWIGMSLDLYTHRIGAWLLTFDPLESTWAALIQLPIVPWTRFNNTVVAGSLLVGLLAAIPVYYLSLRFFMRFGPSIRKRLNQSRLGSLIEGPQLETSADSGNTLAGFES